MAFKVSVIIPVYNAERYVEEAVRSALAQEETGEVILIEDASPDNALAVCERLAESDERVRLYRHPDGQHLGAGPSRNLGIEKATCDYIAFLDADDFYAPDCFKKAKELLSAHPEADGVYGSQGVHFDSPEAKERYQHIARFQPSHTRQEVVHPKDVFNEIGAKVRIHVNTLVLRKQAFAKAGVFNQYRLSQDTHFFYRLALTCTLLSGSIDQPVAIRRVHLENRVHELDTQKMEDCFR